VCASAKQARFDGVFVHVEAARDFGDAHCMKFGHHDDGALIEGQLLDRAHQRVA
jgi:hypothetical protein